MKTRQTNRLTISGGARHGELATENSHFEIAKCEIP